MIFTTKTLYELTPQVSYSEARGNISVYDRPTTIDVGGVSILLLPWICDENYDESFRSVAESSAPIVMGHLEANGFEFHPGHVMHNGMDKSLFSKFKRVFSGHYHMKSKKIMYTILVTHINYTGMTMDVKEDFTSLIQTLSKLLFIGIPLDVFHKLYYNNGVSIPEGDELKGAFVKLIVEDKGDYAKFDYAVTQLQNSGLADLKIIEDLSVDLENNNAVMESEDTMTLLDNYIDEIDLRVSKDNVKSLLRSLYTEAIEL